MIRGAAPARAARPVTVLGLMASVGALTLFGCGDGDEPAPAAAAPSVAVPVTALDQIDLGRVCRATIGAVMGRDPAIIRVDRVEGGIAYVSYRRPSDDSLWENRCRTSGGKVIWSSVNADGPNTGFGRWRDDPLDGDINFEIVESSVRIEQVFADRSRSVETFVIQR